MINPIFQKESLEPPVVPERKAQPNSKLVHIEDMMNEKECVNYFLKFNKYKK